MKILRKISVWLCVLALMCVSAGSWVHVFALEDPAVQAGAAMVVDVKSGRTLYAHNPMVKMYPAGLTKIMTTLLAAEAAESGEVRLSEKVTITEEMLAGLPDGYYGAGLEVGEEISLEELMYCCFMDSANDAAHAIAVHVSGSVERFVDRMNSRAAELGCLGTNFTNPNGYFDENHFTTAEDLNLISQKAYANSTILKIASSLTHTVPATNVSETRRLETSVSLLNSSSWYYCESVDGGKTTYSAEAGDCISVAASNEVFSLVVVILGAETVTNESGNTVDRSFTETSRLIQWVYDNFEYRTILDVSDVMYEVRVEMGDGADSVFVRPTSGINQLMDKNISDKDFVYDIHIYSEESGVPLTAPVQAGDILGEVTVSYGDVIYGTASLAAASSVALMHGEFLRSEFAKVLEYTWIRWLIAGVIILFVVYVAYLILYAVLRWRNRKQAKLRASERIAQLRIRDLQAACQPQNVPQQDLQQIQDLPYQEMYAPAEAAVQEPAYVSMDETVAVPTLPADVNTETYETDE